MKPIRQRSPEAGAEFHRVIPPRIYEKDIHQAERVEAARQMIRKYLSFCSRDIIELGCGAGDISGPFADEAMVLGFDVSDEAVQEAKRRFGAGCFMQGEIDKLFPTRCGVLVLSEVLEHLHDPLGLVKKWAPFCEYMLISHPLDEDGDADLSVGEHQWVFSEGDFREWFRGFEIVDRREIKMGTLTSVMGIGRRI